MRILFTGASSFTGCWIVQELVHAGHEVTAVFTKTGPEDYRGLRRNRLDHVLPLVRTVWETRFGDERFLDLCRDGGPWDVLCHHGADVTDYRSPLFDWQRALVYNTYRLHEVMRMFEAGGGRACVVTGTYFEADEGVGLDPLDAFSSYGLSKTLTWQAFRFECARAGITLGKYVLPSPIGPLEQEHRITAHLANCWKRGEVAEVQTPDYVRDHLPVTLLATDYRAFTDAVALANPRSRLQRNPSGWVETVGKFAERFAYTRGRQQRRIPSGKIGSNFIGTMPFLA